MGDAATAMTDGDAPPPWLGFKDDLRASARAALREAMGGGW